MATDARHPDPAALLTCSELCLAQMRNLGHTNQNRPIVETSPHCRATEADQSSHHLIRKIPPYAVHTEPLQHGFQNHGPETTSIHHSLGKYRLSLGMQCTCL